MRNNDEPDVRVGKTLRDLGRKETGYEKPDEGVGSVLLFIRTRNSVNFLRRLCLN